MTGIRAYARAARHGVGNETIQIQRGTALSSVIGIGGQRNAVTVLQDGVAHSSNIAIDGSNKKVVLIQAGGFGKSFDLGPMLLRGSRPETIYVVDRGADGLRISRRPGRR